MYLNVEEKHRNQYIIFTHMVPLLSPYFSVLLFSCLCLFLSISVSVSLSLSISHTHTYTHIPIFPSCCSSDYNMDILCLLYP